MTDTKPHTSSATNPFFAPFDETEAIPFSRITEADYLPAIKRGIELHSAEIDAIADNPDEPTIDNTLLPLEYGGADLTRVVEVMGPMTSAMSTDTLMSIDAEATPLLAAHSTEVSLNEKLWHRIRSLYDRRHSLGLDAPTMRLLTDCYLSFTRNGALLEGADRERFKELSASLADLSRRFGENLVLEMRDLRLTGTDRAELSGIPAHITGQVTDTPEGGWSLAVSQPVFMEVMRTADNRELRRRLYRLYSGRNFHTAHDNTAILSEIAALRREKASLLGYPTYAHFALAQRMAATPDRVMKLLNDLRDAYRPALAGEMESLRRIAGHDIEPWDYSYYAQKLKAAKYDFDENAMKPYLELSNVTKGVLHMASLLYGIRFDEITGEVDTYHPDVRVYRVSHPDRGTLGLLYLDFFARPTKQPGAWMTEFRGQMQRPDGTPQRPYVTLVTNFVRPASGEPCLLRPSEAETLLHETGHALHSLLSDCRYPSQAGTNVRRDFVELPSQFNEGFLTRPEFLEVAGRHWQTGEPVPQTLVDGLRRVAAFGASYACLRQLGFGLSDMAWHTLATDAEVAEATADPAAFERKATASVAVFDDPDGAPHSQSFGHIFSGGYAAGYYSYKWAEVLAADAFEAVAPAPGSPLDLEAAARFAGCVLSQGDTADPADLYRRFRGRDADPNALLRRDFPAK